MEKLTKRALQAKETEARLIRTASDLIREHGFDNVTIDDICAACGVAKGTFYHYFKTKYDIICVDHKEFLSSLDEVFRVDQEADIEINLVLMINSYIQMVEQRGVEMTRGQTLYIVGGYRNIYEQGSQSIGKITGELLESAVAAGTLRPDTPVWTIQEIVATFICGLITNWCIQNGNFSMTEYCWATSLRLINSLLAPHRASARF